MGAGGPLTDVSSGPGRLKALEEPAHPLDWSNSLQDAVGKVHPVRAMELGEAAHMRRITDGAPVRHGPILYEQERMLASAPRRV